MNHIRAFLRRFNHRHTTYGYMTLKSGQMVAVERVK